MFIGKTNTQDLWPQAWPIYRHIFAVEHQSYRKGNIKELSRRKVVKIAGYVHVCFMYSPATFDPIWIVGERVILSRMYHRRNPTSIERQIEKNDQ